MTETFDVAVKVISLILYPPIVPPLPSLFFQAERAKALPPPCFFAIASGLDILIRGASTAPLGIIIRLLHQQSRIKALPDFQSFLTAFCYIPSQ